MNKIYLLGDIHTVSAFRLAGVEGISTDRAGVDMHLSDLIEKGDAAVIVITRQLAEETAARIYDINLNLPAPVIVEIPGMDDPPGLGRSVIDYITEALGIAM